MVSIGNKHFFQQILIPLFISSVVGFGCAALTFYFEYTAVLKMVGAVLLLFLILGLALTRWHAVGYGINFTVGITVWCVLIFAEKIMVRQGTIAAAAEGAFAQAAVGEIVVWMACALLLFFISLRGLNCFEVLFSGVYKWVTLFVVLTLLSAVYSPHPTYSLAWAFKLTVIVASLAMWTSEIRDLQDIRKVLKTINIVFFITAMLPLFSTFGGYSLFGSDGRYGGIFGPIGISVAGGIAFLTSLVLYYNEDSNKRLFYKVNLIVGLVVLLLSGGKTTIGAAIIATIIFFVALGKARLSIGFIMLVLLLSLAGFILDVPTFMYLQQYYESDMVWTLTGRTDVWAAAIDEILERPLIGHGYLAAKFFTLTATHNLHWEAPHMHNAFLEILYNNGVLGLIPILVMNGAILKNTIGVIKGASNQKAAIMGVGLLSLYVFVFVDGMLGLSFGGRPDVPFILFLAILSMSDKLRISLQHRYQQIPLSAHSDLCVL